MATPTHQVLDLSDAITAAAVLRLQHAAYRIEADLIGFEGIPPLYETLEQLVEAPLQWIGVRSPDGDIAAVLAYTGDDTRIDIDRLIVSPDHFRNRYGTALVAALDPTATVTVSTGSANAPAHRLYEGLGFVRIRAEEVVPGLSITHFVRKTQL